MRALMRFLPAVCAMAVLATPAYAQKGGPYIGIIGGLTLLGDTNFEGAGIPPDGNVQTSWNTGFYVGGVSGYRISDYVRLEAELTYRQNELDKLTASGPGFDSEARNGDMKLVSFLGNLWIDVNVGQSPVAPYIGGGLGIGGAELQLEPVDLGGSGTFLTDESETAFVMSYQLGAGIAYSLSDHFILSLDYRYFATTDPDFTLLRKASAEYQTHNIGVSLRYEF